MATVKIFNQEGKENGELNLNDAVFGVKVKESVVYQVFNALRANARESWADTKNKGEVRGGGKKPWKQKGTGRARHGSIRSPLWRGGGITFGPISARNYQQKINKEMNRVAVRMCLSDKLADGKLVVLESLASEAGKTKAIAILLKKLPCANRSTVLLTGGDENLQKASRNIGKLALQRAQDLNVLDLLENQYLVASKKDLEMLEKRLAK